MLLLFKTFIFTVVSVCVTLNYNKFVQAIISENIELDDEDLVVTYMMLQSFDTGYNKPIVTYDALRGIRNENMRVVIKKYFESDIICFYMFIATHHQCLIKNILSTNIYEENFKYFSFVNQAKIMLLSTYFFTDGSFENMEPVWLIYTYELFLKMVTNRTLSFNPDIIKSFHDRIIATSANFINNSLKCNPLSTYNGQNKTSKYFKQLKSILSLKCTVDLMNSNKFLIDSVTDCNSTFIQIDTLYAERVSYHTFSLKILEEQPDIIKTLLFHFFETTSKSDIETIKVHLKNIEQQNQPDLWVKALGKFWQNFIDLLKYTMVRFICRYIINMNRNFMDREIVRWVGDASNFLLLDPTSTYGIIRKYNQLMLKRLKEFKKILYLDNDAVFNNIIDKILQSNKELFTCNKRKDFYNTLVTGLQAVPPLFDKIKIDTDFENLEKEYVQMRNLSTLVKKDSMILNVENSITDPLIRKCIVFMETYNTFVNRILAKVDMKIIRSFIYFTENLDSNDKTLYLHNN